MTIKNKGTYEDKLTLYVPRHKKKIVEKAKKILDREGSSISQFVMEKLEAHVYLHGPGNPQQTLPHISKEGGPYVAPKTCDFCDGEPVGWAVHKKSKKKKAVCKKHKEALKDHPKWEVLKDV